MEKNTEFETTEGKRTVILYGKRLRW